MKKAIVLLLPILLMTQPLFSQSTPSKDKNINPSNGTASTSKRPGADLPSAVSVVMPTPKQEKVNQLVTEILTKYHYRKLSLNDSLSSAIFDRYLKTLDFNRVYFLASDVAGFEKYRNQIDDDLKEGELEPAYAMFNVFKRHFKERNEYVAKLLEKEFDFSTDEYYNSDREKASWCGTKQELDEEWRKMIKNQALSLKLSGKSWPETAKVLGDRYKVQDKSIGQYNSEDVFQLYMNSFAEAVDPHSSYFSPSTAANFNIDMANALEGIGASLRTENDYTKVAEILAGGPAFKTKLLVKDDKIVAVGQGESEPMVDVIGWRIDEVVKLIRGPKGTTVRLQILPASEGDNALPREIKMVREKVKLQDQAAKKEVVPVTQNGKAYKLGVITLPTFYLDFEAARKKEKDFSSTTRDVRRLIEELSAEKVSGIILDLRNNGGGSLSEAIELTGLFIPTGPVVQVRDMSGSVDVGRDPDPNQVYNGPLAVMINRFSASASEIFAGAIQDYKRGLIIGEQTYGKGTVQNLIDLNRFMPDNSDKLGQLKLTTAKFYRVTGSSTQHRGVTPDIEFGSQYSAEEFGESSEPSALPWDQIASTRFNATNDVSDKLIAGLENKYQQRTKTEPELKNYLEDLKELKEARERNTVSLQETKRKKERDEAEKKRAARNKLSGSVGKPENAKATAKDKEAKQPSTPAKDVYLDETKRIVADWLATVG
ncbi:MAG: carboxy terminal-processing peptidase [Ferruginibacter sp.]|nr:carboxy terminal-processing peptidase [Cytophagales bacterium]